MEVVIFIGPPGAGKGTQADILAEEYGFFHLESSKAIEAKFASDPDDPLVITQKELFTTGKLTSPDWVKAIMMERMEALAGEGKSIVLSGSPRTLEEVQSELPLLERLYGERNVHAIHLDIGREQSIRRNSKRRICKANRHPIPNLPGMEKLSTCPKDGSELITRVLDTPETIAIRFDTYLEETAPVLGFIAGRGYSVTTINGDASIEAVHSRVVEALERNRRPVPQG